MQHTNADCEEKSADEGAQELVGNENNVVETVNSSAKDIFVKGSATEVTLSEDIHSESARESQRNSDKEASGVEVCKGRDTHNQKVQPVMLSSSQIMARFLVIQECSLTAVFMWPPCPCHLKCVKVNRFKATFYCYRLFSC